MVEKIKKIINIEIKDQIVALLLFIALILGIIPLLRLGLYAAPFYDDYSYGLYLKQFLASDGIRGIIPAIYRTTLEMYYAFQGTYGSIIFMSLMPGSFGEQYYFIGSWVMIGILAISSILFVYKFCRLVGNATIAQSYIIAVATSLLMIELVRTANQGFYWYDGAVHYTFMYGLMLFMLTSLLITLKTKALWKHFFFGFVTCILAILVAGANYVTTLQGALLLSLFMIVATFNKNKNVIYVIPAFIIYLWGMKINCLAPGNLVRMAVYTSSGVADSILLSFRQAFLDLWSYTGWITIFVLLALIPTMWNIVIKTDYSYKLPGIVSIFSFCMFATGYTPCFYGMGSAGVVRTWNVIKFTYQLLLVFNCFYWIGWISKKKREITRINNSVLLYALCCLGIVIVFFTSDNKAGNYSSYAAYYYIHTGEAACFRQEYEQRLDAIEKADGGDVVVSFHVYRPWVLCETFELSTNPTAEQNAFMAHYYNVSSIVVDPNTLPEAYAEQKYDYAEN